MALCMSCLSLKHYRHARMHALVCVLGTQHLPPPHTHTSPPLPCPVLPSPPYGLFTGQSQPVPAVLLEWQKLMNSAMHAV